MITRFARSFLCIIITLLVLSTLVFMNPPSRAYIDPWTGQMFGEGGVEADLRTDKQTVKTAESLKGKVIMGKLGNETAKAALGRATWKLLHTMTLRYPEKPSTDEREALEAYFHLTSRLYPCGECASEFQELLRKFPPQTSSRRAASTWLCLVHNEVNKRLHKPDFDCAKLEGEYDCGCGDTPSKGSPSDTSISNKDSSTEVDGDFDLDMERDTSTDELTGVHMIQGGR